MPEIAASQAAGVDLAEADFSAAISGLLNELNRVPRTWLLDELRSRIQRPDCRYLLLVGEPGSGKSGVMASLAAAEPGWLRYFIRADSITPLSSGDAGSVLLSLGHQLALRRPPLFEPAALEIEVEQRLRHAGPSATVTGVQIGDLRVSPFYRTAIRVRQEIDQADGLVRAVQIDRATLEPRLLHPDVLGVMALLDPAAVLARNSPGETIIVLIDALDELGAAAQGSILDWLESGPSLPANLRFILSSRPSPRLETLAAVRGKAVDHFEIDTGSGQVSEDVETFSRGLFSDHAATLEAASVDLEDAVEGLGKVAEGNFAYLTAYARALRAAVGEEDTSAVKELLAFDAAPAGLERLYSTFVRQIRRRVAGLGRMDLAEPDAGEPPWVDPWDGVALSLLGVLSVAKAALTPTQLADLGGIRVWPSALKSVLQLFAPFLEATPQGLQLFHASFAEVLTDQDRPALADIALDPDEWNRKIVRRYQAGRPWQDVDWRKADNYGLLHVASHLASSARGVAELIEVITPNLRSTCLARFGSEAPFRELTRRCKTALATASDPSVAFVGSLFIGLVVDTIGEQAGSLDPAIYGLMARLGRVEEALGRLELTPPGLQTFRALEAVRASTLPAERAHLGQNDGVERLVAAALSIPATATPFVGHLGYDRSQCLLSAAIALAPFERDRALRLLDEMTASLDPEADRRAVHAAANAAGTDGAQDEDRGSSAPHRSPESADVTPPEEIVSLAGWLAEAAERPDMQGDTGLEAQLRTAIEDTARAKESGGAALARTTAYAALNAASILGDFRPDLARDVAARFGRDPAEADLALFAASVHADLGYQDDARHCLEVALAEYRGRGWFGPAGDIALASTIAARFDPDLSRQLAREAVNMLETAHRDGSGDDNRLEFAVAATARALITTDRPQALALARMMSGTWVHGGNWDDVAGRGNTLAMIGLGLVDDDPSGAANLLSEAMAPDKPVRLGRSTPEVTNAGLFQDAQTDRRRGLDMSYVMNSRNYWSQGRTWRWLVTPHEVLGSLEWSYPAGASWARALADNMEYIAGRDLDAAFDLTDRILDPGERLVALAGLASCLYQRKDDRLDEVLGQLEASLGAQRAYSAGGEMGAIPNGDLLAYLDPTVRMRIEAAIRLPEDLAGICISLTRLCRSRYLAACWQAQGFRQQLLNAIGVTLPPETLGGFPERIGQADELFGDLVRVAWVQLAAPDDATLAERIISEIDTPTLAVQARLYVARASGGDGLMERLHAVLETARDEVSPSHFTGLAAHACGLCAAEGVDANPLIQYALTGLQEVDPFIAVLGALSVAEVAAPDLRSDLLTQALDGLDRISVVYHREEVLTRLAACAATLPEGRLLARVAERLATAPWHTLVVGLGLALPHLVDTLGVPAIEQIETALVRAQAVIGGAPMASGHLDGVATAGAPGASADPRIAYLSSYLRQSDLDGGLSRVQDSRLGKPDDGDDAFDAQGGQYSGLAAWEAADDATIRRLVDIRFVFPTEAAAAAYHREQLSYNSEGQPPVKNAPMVAEECAVFGGTQTMRFAEGTLTMTAFHIVFRCGRVVAKVFASQGQAAADPLTVDRVADLARRAEARILSAV